VAASCWNHWRTLTTPLCRPNAVQNFSITWTYRSMLIVTDRSLSSSNQNGPVMPCLEMATQAVQFTESNGLCRQCSGGVLPQKMSFLAQKDVEVMHSPVGSELVDPSVDHRVDRKFTTSEPFFELQLNCMDRLLPKICLNYKYLLLSSPWHLEGQIW